MSNVPFKLSATLVGHSQDVKAVKFVRPDLVFSCSRDTTARVWRRIREKNEADCERWTEELVFQNSNPGFLNAIEIIEFLGKEYLVSAGQDALIQLWPLHPEPDRSYEPQFVLSAHTSNVCCLHVCDSGPENQPTIFSGSWDCSAIVWRNNVTVHILQGHSAAVWAVLGLGDSTDSVLTAGADNMIVLWKQGKQALSFKGHTQAVRALVELPRVPNHFASAGNDATIRIWNLDGHAVRVLDGHDSFIYSISCLPSGEIISSGEDRSARIWDPCSGQLTQTITVPAISVWSVSACVGSGDIVCGSSDNMVRIFTRANERLAPAPELLKFEESVKASSVPSATVGDIKKSDLPSVAVLLTRRGKKEGEVAMAKNEANGAVEAYQWDATKGDWTMVGTVVDGIGSSRKQLFEGTEYDYVFDVDIKDGEPPLKLPYNVSENPYTVAQKWLKKYELPDSYVEQIVEFIDKNTSGVALGATTSGADPLTGAASYRPSNAPIPNSSLTGADPFTGAGSYRPGNGATSSSGLQTREAIGSALLPHTSFLTFPPTSSDFSVVIGKIKQFNKELDSEDPGKAISPSDFDGLTQLTSYLSKPSGQPSQSAITALEKMILNWPTAKQFPAIDLIKVMAISYLPSCILPALLTKVEDLNENPGAELNFTLALRAVNNGLSACPTKTDESDLVNKQDLAKKVYGLLQPGTLHKFKPATKNAKVALATLLLNLSILCVQRILDQDVSNQLVALTSEFIRAESDEEVIYRSLIGLGNLVSAGNILGNLGDRDKKSISGVLSTIQVDKSAGNRLSNAIKEIRALI